MKILMTGGTGLIGRAVIPELLARGDEVIVVSRDGERAARTLPDEVRILSADILEPGPWQESARACDAVINLVGESVGEGLWTGRKKRRLRRSRLRPTGLLAEALRNGDSPSVLVSASATGYYGDGGERALGENAELGHDFLAILCHEWEQSARQVESERCRVVCPRFGVVLAAAGGALGKLLPLYRRGLGGPLGNGRQYLPWIHLNDAVRAIVFALDTPLLKGPMNVTTPHPPRQREFAAALGTALGRPAGLRVPAWVLRTFLGEKAMMLLQGQRAVPNQLKALGFRWSFPDLMQALEDLVCD
jgi:uncharacterized protein